MWRTVRIQPFSDHELGSRTCVLTVASKQKKLPSMRIEPTTVRLEPILAEMRHLR